MNTKDYKINIVGAGISGLIAALVLEKQGFYPTIIESCEQAGGRLKTDIKNSYQLDHGFQVLLTAYPMLRKFLDLEALELQEFVSGAVIYKNGTSKIVADPLRHPSLLWSTITSKLGNLSDQLKIVRLSLSLKKKSIAAIFSEKETTTLEYLTHYGFSQGIITDFFKPFFSGIFLEPNLETSSRMFEFIFKMFGEGKAALPKNGIVGVVDQLCARLQHTEFKFNTNLSNVTSTAVILENGDILDSDATILTVPLKNMQQDVTWRSCDTLYFEVETRPIKKPFIGLIADTQSLINTVFFHTSLQTTIPPKKELVSVTVVKDHGLDTHDLIQVVQQDLFEYCGIENGKFIAHYPIKKALPALTNLSHTPCVTSEISNTVFLAGDYTLNPSLNAAMAAGEHAANMVIELLLKS